MDNANNTTETRPRRRVVSTAASLEAAERTRRAQDEANAAIRRGEARFERGCAAALVGSDDW